MTPEETLSESELDQPVSEEEKALLDARLADAADSPKTRALGPRFGRA